MSLINIKQAGSILKQSKKVMICGDTASGKSTFANQLHQECGFPLIHTDVLRWNTDGQRVADIEVNRALQCFLEQNETWIIEGNVFYAEPNARIEQSDIILLFDFPRINSLWNVCIRWSRIIFYGRYRIGAKHSSKSLDLWFYVPFIFSSFYKQKKRVRSVIESLDKNYVVISSYKDLRFLQHYLFGK